MAEPNAVVIAEGTRKLLGNLFELDDLGPKDLKGTAEPVRAFTALRPTIVVGAVGIALPFTWLGGFLGFVPLPPAYWMALCLILVSYVTLTHFVKTWFDGSG